MKVLHVAETAKGGVLGVLEELVPQQLRQWGEDSVRVVLPADHVGPGCALPVAALRLVPADARRWRRTWSVLQAARSELRHWRPDIVHLHSTYAGAALRPWLATLAARPRVVYCAHGWAFDRGDPGAPGNRAIALVERALARWTDAIVCVSAHDLRSAARIGIAAERLVQIDNGIGELEPSEAARPVQDLVERWPAERIRVLFVGRFDRQKGVDLLLRALEPLTASHHALLIGETVVGASTPLSLPPNTEVVGWQERAEVGRYLRAAEVVVMPSRWEGLPLVALEAMRAGRAVVAARAGGLGDVVADGETGFLVPTDDSQALGDALDSLDRPRLQAMGAAGRLRYERDYRADLSGERIAQLYLQLLSAGAGTAAVGSGV